jgi:hypothetical protein
VDILLLLAVFTQQSKICKRYALVYMSRYFDCDGVLPIKMRAPTCLNHVLIIDYNILHRIIQAQLRKKTKSED